METRLKKRILLHAFIGFYTVAGLMHFIAPDLYLEVIPAWLGNKIVINYLAGVAELTVALLAVFKKTRAIAGYLTMAMLFAFIISHVYFIQLGNCAGAFCIPAWIGYVRLIVIHPILLWWAWNLARL